MITTSYGSWANRADWTSVSVEQSVIAAFVGSRITGYAVTGIAADWRKAINDALPASVSLNGDEFYGPFHAADRNFEGYPMTEEGHLDIYRIVNEIDFWAIAERHAVKSPEPVAAVIPHPPVWPNYIN